MNQEIEKRANNQLKADLERHIEEIRLLPSNLFRRQAIASISDAIEFIKVDSERLDQSDPITENEGTAASENVNNV